MMLHAKALTKPRSADSNDVQDTLDKVALVGNMLSQINTFVAGIKSQSSS
jgi:hypothetical protein